MTTHKLFQSLTEMYCQNFVQTKVLARGPHTHNDYQSRLRVKGKTAPLQNGFCKTAPQRYETAQMQSPARSSVFNSIFKNLCRK